jgi:hypothetical protein
MAKVIYSEILVLDSHWLERRAGEFGSLLRGLLRSTHRPPYERKNDDQFEFAAPTYLYIVTT